MERLKADVSAMIAHVQSLPPNPTIEQLSGKISSLCQAIVKDSLALPKRINEIIQEAFIVVGWDIKRNVAVNKALLNVSNLIRCLQVCCDFVYRSLYFLVETF